MFSTVIIIILGFTIGMLIFRVVDQRSQIEMLNFIRESQNNLIDSQRNLINSKRKLINALKEKIKAQENYIKTLEELNKIKHTESEDDVMEGEQK